MKLFFGRYIFLYLFIGLVEAKAQTHDVVISPEANLNLDIQDIKGGHLSTTIKPYQQSPSLVDTAKSVSTFFKDHLNLLAYKSKEVNFTLNPVIVGSTSFSSEDTERLFVYSRGLELRGTIDQKVAFYSFFTENQARYPKYVRDVIDSTLVIPYEGFWKQFNVSGVDFLRTQGYIDFGFSKSVSAQLGFGKNTVGNGLRSLVLSDFANNYPYFRIATKTKPFDYTNLFAELITNVRGGTFGLFGSGTFSKKYLAFHHLNFKIKPNLHIGLFESVVFGDSTSGFQLEYLNPVIFYRAVEQQNASSANAFVGMDFKWNIRNRYSFYGQLMIDELIVNEALAGEGWWGNKQGFQLGWKYVDVFGIKDLYAQIEFNRVRPYTYAHSDGFTSYSHYNQPLAHPLGANFTEWYGRLYYSFSPQLSLNIMGLYTQYGNDIGNGNYGRDILKNYVERAATDDPRSPEYGVKHLQGAKTDLTMIFLRGTFRWKYNLSLDAEVTFRNESSARVSHRTTIFGVSIRMNAPSRTYLF